MHAQFDYAICSFWIWGCADSAAFDPKQSHQSLHQSAIQERRTIKQNQTTRCKKEYELNAADDREHLLHLYIQYFFPFLLVPIAQARTWIEKKLSSEPRIRAMACSTSGSPRKCSTCSLPRSKLQCLKVLNWVHGASRENIDSHWLNSLLRTALRLKLTQRSKTLQIANFIKLEDSPPVPRSSSCRNSLPLLQRATCYCSRLRWDPLSIKQPTATDWM